VLWQFGLQACQKANLMVRVTSPNVHDQTLKTRSTDCKQMYYVDQSFLDEAKGSQMMLSSGFNHAVNDEDQSLGRNLSDNEESIIKSFKHIHLRVNIEYLSEQQVNGQNQSLLTALEYSHLHNTLYTKKRTGPIAGHYFATSVINVYDRTNQSYRLRGYKRRRQRI
jgi:hypothetical protein